MDLNGYETADRGCGCKKPHHKMPKPPHDYKCGMPTHKQHSMMPMCSAMMPMHGGMMQMMPMYGMMPMNPMQMGMMPMHHGANMALATPAQLNLDSLAAPTALASPTGLQAAQPMSSPTALSSPMVMAAQPMYMGYPEEGTQEATHMGMPSELGNPEFFGFNQMWPYSPYGMSGYGMPGYGMMPMSPWGMPQEDVGENIGENFGVGYPEGLG